MVAFGNCGLYAPAGDLGFKTLAAGNGFCIRLRADGSIAHFASGFAAQLPFAAMDIHDAVAVSVNPQLYGSATDSDSHTLGPRKDDAQRGCCRSGRRRLITDPSLSGKTFRQTHVTLSTLAGIQQSLVMAQVGHNSEEVPAMGPRSGRCMGRHSLDAIEISKPIH